MPQRFYKNESGATAVEFAIVASALFMLILGIMEYGLIMYTQSQVEAITSQAARDVGIGATNKAGCTDRVSCIKNLIQQKSVGLIDNKSLIITATVVTNGQTPPSVPDICLDNANDPFPKSCTKWENNDGVAGYQQTSGLSAGSVGAAGDLVQIRVTYLWRVLFPFFRSKFGQNGVLTISSATIVKNEPFGSN